MATTPLPVLQPRPAQCSAVAQTPPDFNWPHRRVGDRYQLVVRDAAGAQRSATTSSNWYMWPEAFAPGDYSWWVVARDGSGTERRSATRAFTVPPSAARFVVPLIESLLESTQTRPRPRGLPAGAELEALRRALDAERATGWRAMLARIEADLVREPAAEPTTDPRGMPDRAAQVKVIQALWATMNVEQTRIIEAAFVAAMTRSERHVAHARKLVLALAAWDPSGPSSQAAQFQVNRAVAITLALGYDWLHEAWSADERGLLLHRIGQRTQPIAESVIGRQRNMEINALNSVGLTNLGVVAAIAALTLGVLPQAEEWFRQAVPLYTNLLWPWGGDDGGYANGTNYAMWEIADAWVVLDVLRNASGLNLGDKPYLRNFGRMLAYFEPPASRRGVFGDGAEQEMPHVYARYVKALSLRVTSPELAWLAAATHGEDPSNPALVMGPAVGAGALTTAPPSNDLVVPSVGWAAMHSKLADNNRVSVYFKSSPYGSISHSHADQNSFVLHVGVQPLLMAGGRYDWYGSPHGMGFYKQTRAHNAVTFDGGAGQKLLDQGATGRIAGFQAGDSLAWVEGDATRAYGGQLSAARRRVAFFKPDLVVIQDLLSSVIPRIWEINLHAREAFRWTDGQLEVSNGSAKACGAVWSEAGIDFAQTSVTSPPPSGSDAGRQWHGVFAARGRLTDARLVTVIDLACRAAGHYRVVPGVKALEVIAGGIAFSMPLMEFPQRVNASELQRSVD